VYKRQGYLKDVDPNDPQRWPPLRIDKATPYLEMIVDGINLLRKRTQGAIRHMQRISRYVAHELRTPLTIIQGEAETALLDKNAGREEYAQVMQSSLEEVRRMSDIVDTVLSMGETKNGPRQIKLMPYSLAEWLTDNIRYFEKLLLREINLILPAEPVPLININARLFFRLIDNLMRNIKVHTPEGSVCLVKLKKIDKYLDLIISDSGPGLPEEVLNSLNKEQADSEYANVGLHISCRIAEILGTRLHFENKPEGGLAVIISFPQILT
jgi:two-component system sensor histidine kinase QseC